MNKLRTLLTLGRVSNLPTVWSNCIAAWLIAGGRFDRRLALVCAGASFLYIGGMFLNDACDVSFDQQHRAERPIPSGKIPRSTVFGLAFLWLILGVACFFNVQASLLLTVTLVIAIITYNFLHKIFPPAVVLMAVCRFLLYMVAASAVAHQANSKVRLAAAVMAVYVFCISLVARNESSGEKRWLLVPTVGRLIAGIVLIDCLIVVSTFGFALYPFAVFAVLFILALVSQRRVAAT